MKRKSLNLLCVLAVGVMFLVTFIPIGSVVAPVAQQHNIWTQSATWGITKGVAGPLTGSNEVTAWIDGVIYGTNITWSGDAESIDLYCDGDTWGVDPDDWVKQGGFNGDTIQYFINYDPADYYFNISDHTSTFLEGAYEQVDLYFDTQTYTDTAIGDTYLRGLKINEIVRLDNLGLTYVIIYDPMGDLDHGELTHATKGYYLQKDDSSGHTPNGEIFDFNPYSLDVIQYTGTKFWYINLTGVMSFDPTFGDELKLVWKNPGGGDFIANETDVIVDRVEWGDFHNLHAGDYSWRDYDNTTLLDAIGIPAQGQRLYRVTDGVDTDNCEVDFSIDTSPTPPPPSGGMPGAPSNLRVHKGGGAWGGTINDIVLTWNAPTVDYGNLVNNVIYYDLDLSDGFQYSLSDVQPTTDPGAGNEDSAILNNFLVDGNDYAFIVRTTGDAVAGGPNENPTGTNIGYKYVESLLANTPPKTSQKFVSIPYFCDWTSASDIAGAGTEFTDGSKIAAVLRWDYATQQFESRTYLGAPFYQWNDDFPITPGDTIAVGITTTSPYNWVVVGAYDDTTDFTFDANTPPLTSQMFTSLPFHTSYTMASDVSGPGTEFTDGSTITSVLQWNYNGQKFDSRTWLGAPFYQWNDDFPIDPFPGGHLAFGIFTTSPYVWQPQVMGL